MEVMITKQSQFERSHLASETIQQFKSKLSRFAESGNALIIALKHIQAEVRKKDFARDELAKYAVY